MSEHLLASAVVPASDLEAAHSGLVSCEKEAGAPATWAEVFSYPQPLVVGIGLVLLQQVTGQPSVLFYTQNIFDAAGFGAHSAALALGLGVAKLVATSISVLNVDKYGRRLLLFVGISAMALALAMLSAAFHYQTCGVPVPSGGACPSENVQLPKAWAYVTVAGLILYVCGYQVGFGPVSWL